MLFSQLRYFALGPKIFELSSFSCFSPSYAIFFAIERISVIEHIPVVENIPAIEHTLVLEHIPVI